MLRVMLFADFGKGPQPCECCNAQPAAHRFALSGRWVAVCGDCAPAAEESLSREGRARLDWQREQSCAS